MKLTEILNQIKVLLSGVEAPVEEVVTEIEVNLEEIVLADGETTITAESFEAGNAVFIVVPESDPVPVPVGEYELSDGRILVVEEEGIILSVGEAPVEEEEVEPELESTELQDLTQKVLDLEQVIADLKSQLQLSEVTITEKDSEITELNTKLSKLPAAKPVKKVSKYIETKFSKISRENSSKKSGYKTILQHIEEAKNKN